MPRDRTLMTPLGAGLLLCLAACNEGKVPPSVTLDQVPGHDKVAQDNSHKEPPRLVPAEAYMRTYLRIFGDRSALEAQTELQAGGAALFDSWNAYLGALGLPNYAIDLPRKEETNALMVAAFERLGAALCDKALEKDLATAAVAQRMIYAFDVPKDPVDLAGFAPRFDVLHRTFLGYPAKLAPTADRVARYFATYQDVVKKHPGDPRQSRLTAAQAGWAAMCAALLRHPEFQLY